MALPAIYRPTIPGTALDAVVTLDNWSCATNSADVVDSQGTEWWLTGDMDGWHGTAGVRLFGADRASEHGQFDAPSLFGPRVVALQGTAISTSKAAANLARDIVSSLCYDPSRLYVMQVAELGVPTRRCSVRLNAPVKVSSVSDAAFDWQVVLKAPDPRRYDDTESALVLQPPTGATGGIQFPLTLPFSFSTTGLSTSSGVATNAGTIACKPVVEFRGPLVDPQIAHLGQAKSLGMQITLATGDVLVADFDRHTIVLNGSASRATTLTASAAWWQLDPGGNDLVLTAGGGDGTATVRWRSSWH